MAFQYPAICSRTLDPSGKSLRTIVALHDHEITDADINLIQDLQDQKLAKLIGDHGVTSGGLTYTPFQITPSNPNTFFIPAFDVLFNSEVISIQGQQSADLTLSRVQVPTPPALVTGDEDARLYIVFLEIWYQALNPITGTGYYQDPLNLGPKYFYPYGGVLPDPSNATVMPDDSVDPFQGLFTTERAQIQWRLNVQRVALDYDFTQETFGFHYPNARLAGTKGPLDPGQIVYGQGTQPTAIPGLSPLAGIDAYKFTNMGAVNGDTGMWRCGDGNVNNSLGTMDGYSYGMPVAVVFQRNTGNFNLTSNVFGCADSNVANSGLLATRVSGRYDQKLADGITVADVIDTRSTVKLSGVDMDDTMRKGFVDLVMGTTALAIGRGESPGNSPEAVGSRLAYYVAMSPSQITNTDTVGSFDGFANGFTSDTRTFYSTRAISTNQKATGTPGIRWTVNDSFSISLPQLSNATITSINVTALVSSVVAGTKSAAALLQGQVQVDGLNSKIATVKLIADLAGTPFDPGTNKLYVTVGATYPAGSGTDTRKIPTSMQGGTIYDHVSGKTLPVFGVSEYQVTAILPALEAALVQAVNPEYSDIILGTKVWMHASGSSGTSQTTNGISQTKFLVDCKGLNGNVNGLYCTRAWDFTTGAAYHISSRLMASLPNNGGIQHTVVLDSAVDPNSTVVLSIVAQDTAQLAFNAPVKGVVQFEETVLFGNYTQDSNFPVDSRINVESVSYNATTDTNTIVLGANNCTIKGVAGDDTIRLIWVKDNSGNLVAQPVASANFSNGVITLTVSGSNGAVTLADTISAAPFLLVGSILPAFDPQSKLVLELEYLPYQGEGVINRDYHILHSEDNALITTNGTGSAPTIGITDVYPYNREFPLAVSLPSQLSWDDATLANAPVATLFDSNFVAMRQNNVEHTFEATLHSNDFVPPINKDIRKMIRFIAAGARGYARAVPHLGFAIAPPSPRTVLGENLQVTQAPITLYIDNVSGNDNNTGLSLGSAKRSITAALAELPPVLRHPCTLILRTTNLPYSIAALSSLLDTIALGDGDIRQTKVYALGNLSRVMQNEGRLVISREPTATDPIVIDATGFSGFGDGPTAAFYIENSRVIFNGMKFVGFFNPAIIAYNSDVDYVDCDWQNNIQAGAYVGCDSVILDRGSLQLTTGGTGHVLAQSNLTSSGHLLLVDANATPQSAFYVATRNSTMSLKYHGTTTLEETNLTSATVVATAQLNSSIALDGTFQTSGNAVLSANSVLLRTVSVEPFAGGVVTDSSSTVVIQVG